MSTPSTRNLYEVVEWKRRHFRVGMPVVRTETNWAYGRRADGQVALGEYVPGTMIDIVVSSDPVCTMLRDPNTDIKHGPYPTSNIRALKVNFTPSRIAD